MPRRPLIKPVTRPGGKPRSSDIRLALSERATSSRLSKRADGRRHGVWFCLLACHDMLSVMTVEDVEKAVSRLPPEELARFRAWFEEFDAARFDDKIARDAVGFADSGSMSH